MHPLKNLNVWGDGGIITTNNKKIYEKLKLLRNHGLESRDNCKIYGYNSRLDTIQAAVGLEMIKKINLITNKRISNAKYLILLMMLLNLMILHWEDMSKNLKKNFVNIKKLNMQLE